MNPQQPLITIITPTYNRRQLLQRSVESVINQSFKNWQLIIVDDGSTDDTAAMLHPYLADARIQYMPKEHSGQSDSLNKAAAFAKGKFLTFLDSDDEAYHNWLQLVSEILTPDTGIACTGAVRKFSDGTSIREGLSEFRFFGKKMHLKFTSGSLFIRTDIFRDIGGYDVVLRCNTQTDLGYRLMNHLRKTPLKINAINESLVQINIHDGERIRTNWDRRREGGMQFIRKHYWFIYKNDPRELSNIYASIAFSSYQLRRHTESVWFLLKAIVYNPLRPRNYLRIFKYAFTSPVA